MPLPYLLAAALNLGPVRLFTGKDLLPPAAFYLKGHDPNSTDDTSILPRPWIGRNDNGDTLVYIVYKSPVEGECGVFTTKDTTASMDHVDIHGAFDTTKGQTHISGGMLSAYGEEPGKYILFVVCLPSDVKTPAQAKAEAKFSARYEVSTFPVETS